MAGAKLPLTDRGKSQIKAVGATGDFGGYWSGRNWTDGWTAKGSSCEGDLVVDGQDRGGPKNPPGLSFGPVFAGQFVVHYEPNLPTECAPQ